MNLKPLLILIIFSIFSVGIYSKQQGYSMSTLNNKPLFTLKLKAFGTAYFVKVNGASIHREYDDNGQLSTSFPVNHWMRSGENTLELILLPVNQGDELNKNAHVEIELVVASNDTPENTTSLATIKFEGKHKQKDYTLNSSKSGTYSLTDQLNTDPGGNIKISEVQTAPVSEFKGAIRLTRSLIIPSSLPLWAFFQSDDLPDLEPMTDEEYYAFMDTLFAEYMKVQKAIKDGTIDEIIDLFSERNNELDAAFYYTPGTMKSKIKNSLENASTDEDLELSDLKRDYLDFTVEDNNKLISLTRTGLKSAIVLNFKSGYGSQRYSLIFRRKDRKWILTR